MTQEQYERRKARLDEQLRAGVELLESAHRAQMRALDLVWMMQAEEGSAETEPTSENPPAPLPEPPRRRRAPEVDAGVRAALPRLPATFTRGDVCEALGYEPDRTALYRTLQNLTREGTIRVESPGGGQRAATYRKTDA